MGTSYDGVYLFGCLSDNKGDEGWAPATRAAFGEESGFDFEEWLDWYCEVPANTGDYRAWRAAREAKITEKFGCTFEYTSLGYCDYPVYAIFPKGAYAFAWRSGRVPNYSPEQIEHWRQCMEKLRAVLPGLSEPGLYFGCSVG